MTPGGHNAARVGSRLGAVRIALVTAALFLVAAPGLFAAPARAQAPPADVVASAQVAGPPELVIGPDDLCPSWVNPDPNAPPEAHKIHDVPDQPARAFRNNLGQTVLIAADRVTRVSVGPDLDHLTRDCSDPPAFASRYGKGVWSFDVRSWLTSPYAMGDGNVYGLMSEDYHAGLDSRAPASDCPSGVKNRCWFNAITWVSSSNWGQTFTHRSYAAGQPPRYLVASIPYRYEPDDGPMGYFSPSNTVRGIKLVSGTETWDGYYYVMFKAEAYEAQEKGTCLMRTDNLANPSSWRAWSGSAFSVQFVNPYKGPTGSPYPSSTPPAYPGQHVCAPVARAEIGTMHKSVTYSTYLHRYILVSPDSVRGVQGVYFSTSPDLINWTPERLLWAQALKNKDDPPSPTDVISYASLLDPMSTDRNYQTTGQHPYLYFTHYDWHCDLGDSARCETTDSRSLERVPIDLQLAG
jgi:hypothetical protein